MSGLSLVLDDNWLVLELDSDFRGLPRGLLFKRAAVSSSLRRSSSAKPIRSSTSHSGLGTFSIVAPLLSRAYISLRYVFSSSARRCSSTAILSSFPSKGHSWS